MFIFASIVLGFLTHFKTLPIAKIYSSIILLKYIIVYILLYTCVCILYTYTNCITYIFF